MVLSAGAELISTATTVQAEVAEAVQEVSRDYEAEAWSISKVEWGCQEFSVRFGLLCVRMGSACVWSLRRIAVGLIIAFRWHCLGLFFPADSCVYVPGECERLPHKHAKCSS